MLWNINFNTIFFAVNFSYKVLYKSFEYFATKWSYRKSGLPVFIFIYSIFIIPEGARFQDVWLYKKKPLFYVLQNT